MELNFAGSPHQRDLLSEVVLVEGHLVLWELFLLWLGALLILRCAVETNFVSVSHCALPVGCNILERKRIYLIFIQLAVICYFVLSLLGKKRKALLRR